jgi:uncharacterized repeat protein (TIGR03806 family)
MEYRRSIRPASNGWIAGLALTCLALGCSSDPPGASTGHAGNASTAGAATSGGAGVGVGGTGQVAGGGGGEPGVAPAADVSPPFNPTPPVPLTSRWSGTIVAEYSENYTFRVTASAPVRALIKSPTAMASEQILRDWTAQGSRVAVGSYWLAAGTTYQFDVEAATAVADPGLVVEWESPSKQRGVVPKSTVADAGIAKLDPVAPYFNGKFPSSTPSSSAVATEPASGNLGLGTVMAISSHPSTPNLYIVGRKGQIKSIDPTTKTDTGKVFLDISQGTFTGQDSGLMNMVFHPQYGQAGSANRNYIYVYYISNVTADGTVRLSRFTATEGQNTVDKSTEKILISEPLADTYHRGGGMTFGKDGFLYAALGEYGNPNNGQDFTSRITAGVIRIDVDQDATKSHAITVHSAKGTNDGYFIPNDNPWVGKQDGGKNILEEYYTKGERNPHKLTMDSESGRMFTGTVGGNTDKSQEEINEIVKGGNYGWPFREGNRDLGAWSFVSTHNTYQVTGKPATLQGTLQDANLVLDRPNSCGGVNSTCPDLTMSTNAKCIIGGYVYRGSALPNLTGRYLFGDCNLGIVWATTDERAHGPITQQFNSPFVEIVTFGQDRDGELYLAGTDQRVYKIVPAGAPVNDPPALISKLGVFSDLANLTPAPGVIPYHMSTPLWSDGAKKARWMIVPNDANQKIDVTADGSWNFPAGTVFVKHFELEQASGPPHRLETRFLVHTKDDRYYGVTYKWKADNSDADLQDPKSLDEKVGGQTWHYPSRGECMRCHNSAANYVLGPKTAQVNAPLYYPSSQLTANMVSTLQGLGLFKTAQMPASLPQMPSLHEGTAFAAERARAYLEANCAQCHRPDGPARGNWDGRFSTPLNMQQLIGAAPVEALSITGAKVLAPQSPETSILFKRLAALDGTAMPPLARSIVDDSAVSVFSAWLAGMNLQPKPGKPAATNNNMPGLSLKTNTTQMLALAGTDPDGDALDYRISRMPVHGTLQGFGKDLVYSPNPDFTGVDAFTFVVGDGAAESDAGTVQLTVTP